MMFANDPRPGTKLRTNCDVFGTIGQQLQQSAVVTLIGRLTGAAGSSGPSDLIQVETLDGCRWRVERRFLELVT